MPASRTQRQENQKHKSSLAPQWILGLLETHEPLEERKERRARSKLCYHWQYSALYSQKTALISRERNLSGASQWHTLFCSIDFSRHRVSCGPRCPQLSPQPIAPRMTVDSLSSCLCLLVLGWQMSTTISVWYFNLGCFCFGLVWFGGGGCCLLFFFFSPHVVVLKPKAL